MYLKEETGKSRFLWETVQLSGAVFLYALRREGSLRVMGREL